MPYSERMFPTGVGMNRIPIRTSGAHRDVPHRRGDEPSGMEISTGKSACSPQAWG